ncbi:IclR family transcriptional regulator [Actinomycetospora termitidis]|uniref:IclR family transcriptional regulator n=1 Tax=Actinomycetospora termitidis TaxID=3053470 RepID=A0ABT7MI86_9PSEU|nr:IclR family transcriptional regulator [Actinomycetospora sp. Odt1-22]MDL5159657.1 IclR family transcriptional regulator [Actinomycetospora sp. Odt1-22]
MQRVVAILESVAASPTPATAARVSEDIELSLSTVSRIMRELADERMLDRTDEGSYLLGARMFRLVRRAREGGEPMAVVHRALGELRDRTGETASLNVRRGDNRVCIASADSRQELRRVVPVGDAIPMVGTATGDVLMADLPPAEQTALIDRAGRGVGSRVDLLARLEQTAGRGWSVQSDGLVAGVTGVAVPVRAGNELVAALTLSGPTTRLPEAAVGKLLPDLEDAAARIAPWLGTG